MKDTFPTWIGHGFVSTLIPDMEKALFSELKLYLLFTDEHTIFQMFLTVTILTYDIHFYDGCYKRSIL